jgi:methylmalonyl-CoA/ethylmalonyl-CoA epimerase
MIEDLSFHHIGVACRDLSKNEGAYSALGYARVSEFEDPGLGVRGVILEGRGPRLELIADLPGERVVAPWLVHDAAMYHLAYETANLAASLVAASDHGAKVIRRPKPAVAFEGRLVAFVMLRNLALVELISTE